MDRSGGGQLHAEGFRTAEGLFCQPNVILFGDPCRKVGSGSFHPCLVFLGKLGVSVCGVLLHALGGGFQSFGGGDALGVAVRQNPQLLCNVGFVSAQLLIFTGQSRVRFGGGCFGQLTADLLQCAFT